MEMVKSLVDMVSTLVSEVQPLKTDNHALKTQLRDLQQVPSMRCEATSSVRSPTSASASTAMKKSYRNIVCAVDGCPGSTIVTGVHPSKDDFVTVVTKKRVNPSAVNSISSDPNSTKKPRMGMIGVRNSSSLPVVEKKVRMKSLFVSRFSPDVTATDVEKSLKDQLQFASLACTRLRTKHNSYALFHVCY
jgi:hypothetical protein